VNKMKLHLDALAVESFDTTATVSEKGTVFGEQCTCPTVCTCPGCPTCDATCAATCDDYTCAASCGGSCAASCWETCRPRLCTGPDITIP